MKKKLYRSKKRIREKGGFATHRDEHQENYIGTRYDAETEIKMSAKKRIWRGKDMGAQQA